MEHCLHNAESVFFKLLRCFSVNWQCFSATLQFHMLLIHYAIWFSWLCSYKTRECGTYWGHGWWSDGGLRHALGPWVHRGVWMWCVCVLSLLWTWYALMDRCRVMADAWCVSWKGTSAFKPQLNVQEFFVVHTVHAKIKISSLSQNGPFL